MANLFVISDTHFGHENIIGYCGRPFSCAAEMDEAIVDRWNATVRPQDHVYHLGDVAMKKPHLEIVKRLNGHKRLIPGNHDIFEAEVYLRYFEKVCGMRVLDGMLLTHIPIHAGSLGRFKANIHGHIHNADSLPLPYVNVSVEVTDYRPLALEEVKQRAQLAVVFAEILPLERSTPVGPRA